MGSEQRWLDLKNGKTRFSGGRGQCQEKPLQISIWDGLVKKGVRLYFTKKQIERILSDKMVRESSKFKKFTAVKWLCTSRLRKGEQVFQVTTNYKRIYNTYYILNVAYFYIYIYKKKAKRANINYNYNYS